MSTRSCGCLVGHQLSGGRNDQTGRRKGRSYARGYARENRSKQPELRRAAFAAEGSASAASRAGSACVVSGRVGCGLSRFCGGAFAMNRPEQAFQIALVSHLRARLPRPWMVWATPNGGEAATARKHGIRKAMGVLAGVPDLFVAGPGCKVIGIECKAPPNRLRGGGLSGAKARVSDVQRDAIASLGECGIPTIVVRDIDAAVVALTQLGVPIKGRSM